MLLAFYRLVILFVPEGRLGRQHEARTNCTSQTSLRDSSRSACTITDEHIYVRSYEQAGQARDAAAR